MSPVTCRCVHRIGPECDHPQCLVRAKATRDAGEALGLENGTLVAIELLTRSGDFVVTAIVPNFTTKPADVIVWGSRAFHRVNGEYREAFVFTATRTRDRRVTT